MLILLGLARLSFLSGPIWPTFFNQSLLPSGEAILPYESHTILMAYHLSPEFCC